MSSVWDPETELDVPYHSRATVDRARSPARTSHVFLHHLRPLVVTQSPQSLDQACRNYCIEPQECCGYSGTRPPKDHFRIVVRGAQRISNVLPGSVKPF
jgi:hypothetical protein